MQATATIELHGAVVLVRQRGRLASLLEARALQQRVRLACAPTSCRRAVFDNRDTEAPDEEVRRAMVAWAAESFDRVALLLESELVAVRTNMDALSSGTRMRAFGSMEAAIAWVRR